MLVRTSENKQSARRMVISICFQGYKARSRCINIFKQYKFFHAVYDYECWNISAKAQDKGYLVAKASPLAKVRKPHEFSLPKRP